MRIRAEFKQKMKNWRKHFEIRVISLPFTNYLCYYYTLKEDLIPNM